MADTLQNNEGDQYGTYATQRCES